MSRVQSAIDQLRSRFNDPVYQPNLIKTQTFQTPIKSEHEIPNSPLSKSEQTTQQQVPIYQPIVPFMIYPAIQQTIYPMPYQQKKRLRRKKRLDDDEEEGTQLLKPIRRQQQTIIQLPDLPQTSNILSNLNELDRIISIISNQQINDSNKMIQLEYDETSDSSSDDDDSFDKKENIELRAELDKLRNQPQNQRIQEIPIEQVKIIDRPYDVIKEVPIENIKEVVKRKVKDVVKEKVMEREVYFHVQKQVEVQLPPEQLVDLRERIIEIIVPIYEDRLIEVPIQNHIPYKVDHRNYRYGQ